MPDARGKPTMVDDERKAPVTTKDGSMKGMMRGMMEDKARSMPTMADMDGKVMRETRTTSDGIGDMAKGMMGGKDSVIQGNAPLPPSRRMKGDRPG